MSVHDVIRVGQGLTGIYRACVKATSRRLVQWFVREFRCALTHEEALAFIFAPREGIKSEMDNVIKQSNREITMHY